MEAALRQLFVSFLETEIVLCDTAIAALEAGETKRARKLLSDRVFMLRKDHGDLLKEMRRAS